MSICFPVMKPIGYCPVSCQKDQETSAKLAILNVIIESGAGPLRHKTFLIIYK